MPKRAPLSSLSPLQRRVVREIIAMVRRDGLAVGAHLRENAVAAAIGISRSPVQTALHWLAETGVLRKDTHKGYFLTQSPNHWHKLVKDVTAAPDDPLYLQLAQARQTNSIAHEVSEAALMRHFNVARGTLRKVLARISEEGWAEQRIGHGWHFLPMIDSPDAYEESYFFRQTIEPAGLLSPSFQADPQQLADIQREQETIAQDGYLSMTAIELFEANRRFHETLATWSHNRFIAQSVRRVNQLRRLVEYRQAAQRPPRQTQASEHLQILDAIAAQDAITAAALMRAHLDGARRSKSQDHGLFK